jgi:hypothetical protein
MIGPVELCILFSSGTPTRNSLRIGHFDIGVQDEGSVATLEQEFGDVISISRGGNGDVD